jgi:hypothetical protein
MWGPLGTTEAEDEALYGTDVTSKGEDTTPPGLPDDVDVDALFGADLSGATPPGTPSFGVTGVDVDEDTIGFDAPSLSSQGAGQGQGFGNIGVASQGAGQGQGFGNIGNPSQGEDPDTPGVDADAAPGEAASNSGMEGEDSEGEGTPGESDDGGEFGDPSWSLGGLAARRKLKKPTKRLRSNGKGFARRV